ncbi:MAG: hypothetical protein Q9227_009373 [Pyrenula ochraceoflavens]
MDIQSSTGSKGFLSLPLAEKWEYLRPEITRLYIDDRKKLPEVMNEIRQHHPSPNFANATTPEGIFSIASTPAAAATPSWIADAPSPLTGALVQKAKVKRAKMFIEGNHTELAMELPNGEKWYDPLCLVKALLLTIRQNIINVVVSILAFRIQDNQILG